MILFLIEYKKGNILEIMLRLFLKVCLDIFLIFWFGYKKKINHVWMCFRKHVSSYTSLKMKTEIKKQLSTIYHFLHKNCYHKFLFLFSFLFLKVYAKQHYLKMFSFSHLKLKMRGNIKKNTSKWYQLSLYFVFSFFKNIGGQFIFVYVFWLNAKQALCLGMTILSENLSWMG